MKKLKKFLFNLVLTEEQKRLIWESMEFSYKTYLRRSDIVNKDKMGEVRKATRELFQPKTKTNA